MNGSLGLRRHIPLYENPYNTRKKVISKPLVIVTTLTILFCWMFFLVRFLHFNAGNGSIGHNGNKLNPAFQQAEKSSKSSRMQKEEKRVNPINAKKRKKKDTNDYRNIKIETPPPKSKRESWNIDQVLKNLTDTNPTYVGREKLVRMLLEMYIDPTQIDDSIWLQVPVWDDIVKVHGTDPVIYGLDSCERFRNTVDPLKKHVGIAGMFNTGTNLLAIILQHNCGIPEAIKKLGRKKGHGMEWQVPWGKHTPAWYRGKARVKNFIGDIEPENMLVAVMLRDPHDWMASMCRHGYTARWDRNSANCPNLYDGNIVNAKFGPGPSKHDSLAHMWNDWNGAYYNADYPRVLVRFEDTIFFPKEVAQQVCTCVGGELFPPKENDGLFHYVIDSAKTGPGHGPGKKRNGLIDAWIKYGKAQKIQLGKSDLEFSAKHLNRDIVEAMHWKFPPIPDS